MKRLVLAIAILGMHSLALAADPPKPKLQAGAAAVNITPPLGMNIVGGFAPYPSDNVHDELHARCLLLDDGRIKIAMIVCDLLGIDRTLSLEARKLIAEECGIPADRVLISGTHTHSASSALGKIRGAPKQELDSYQNFIIRRLIDAVKCAQARLRPAEIAFVTAQAPEHLFNRRWYMKPGTVPPNPFGTTDLVKMNPPGGSKDLDRPAGPTDPGISIIAVRELGAGPFIALYSAYSLHYVGGVKGADISADYYGIYCGQVEQALSKPEQDPPVVAMMANGTSGDINNINFKNPRPRQKPYEQMRFVAKDVAGKVLAAVEKAQYRDSAPLAAVYRELNIASRRPSAEEIENAKKILAGPAPEKGKVNLPYIYAQRTMGMLDIPETIPVPLQILRIGDICIGTMPVEVFCEIGLEFKKRCPAQPAFLVSLSHGYFGYLPTPEQHKLGGYETWLGTNRLEQQASVKMLDALIQMTQETQKATAQAQR